MLRKEIPETGNWRVRMTVSTGLYSINNQELLSQQDFSKGNSKLQIQENIPIIGSTLRQITEVRYSN